MHIPDTLIRQNMKFREHSIHAPFIDRVQTVGRCGYRREAHFVKAQILLQVAENLDYVGHAVSEASPAP